jgi:hypothetical protein
MSTAQLWSWLPFLVLVLAWIFLWRRQQGGTNEFLKAQLTETQRMNALLERIAVALEKRADTPATAKGAT